MKIYFFLIFFPLILGTTPAEPCNCLADTIPTEADRDTAMDDLVNRHIERVDSAINERVRAADSLDRLADSLEMEVKRLTDRERKKNRVLGRVDMWNSKKWRHVWKWYYQVFPGGVYQYDTIIKKSYKDVPY